MRYYAGIDGGQSSTSAVVADESGSVLGRGFAAPADEVAQGPESTRLRDALRAAVDDALANAGLPPDTRFASIVAGISGYDGTVYGAPADLPAERMMLVHDTVIAHAGALGGEPGVVVIAGTGSVAYARGEDGATALCGGWGYLFGDEGSAFWIARESVADAMRDEDAGVANELTPRILEHFSHGSLRAFVRAFYAGSISRGALAAFAPIALAHDPQRAADAAAALAVLAKRAAARAGLSSPDVAFVGGLLQNTALNEQIDAWMHELLPDARRVQPLRPAAEGALLMAYRGA